MPNTEMYGLNNNTWKRLSDGTKEGAGKGAHAEVKAYVNNLLDFATRVNAATNLVCHFFDQDAFPCYECTTYFRNLAKTTTKTVKGGGTMTTQVCFAFRITTYEYVSDHDFYFKSQKPALPCYLYFLDGRIYHKNQPPGWPTIPAFPN